VDPIKGEEPDLPILLHDIVTDVSVILTIVGF
jgi:hypothetical protein